MIKVDVNEITVTVKGREVTLSEKELVSILEQHFKILNVVKGVEVNPITIDESIFEIGEKEHYYSHEEYIMQLIQKAFIEMKKDLRRYARPFEIVTPAELEPVYTEETPGGLQVPAGGGNAHQPGVCVVRISGLFQFFPGVPEGIWDVSQRISKAD